MLYFVLLRRVVIIIFEFWECVIGGYVLKFGMVQEDLQNIFLDMLKVVFKYVKLLYSQWIGYKEGKNLYWKWNLFGVYSVNIVCMVFYCFIMWLYLVVFLVFFSVLN